MLDTQNQDKRAWLSAARLARSSAGFATSATGLAFLAYLFGWMRLSRYYGHFGAMQLIHDATLSEVLSAAALPCSGFIALLVGAMTLRFAFSRPLTEGPFFLASIFLIAVAWTASLLEYYATGAYCAQIATFLLLSASAIAIVRVIARDHTQSRRPASLAATWLLFAACGALFLAPSTLGELDGRRDASSTSSVLLTVQLAEDSTKWRLLRQQGDSFFLFRRDGDAVILKPVIADSIASISFP